MTFDVVKAAKADNADIPKSLWNRRITSGFSSHTPASLDHLRELLVVRMVRKLYQELKLFLEKTFGVHWFDGLTAARQQRLQQGGDCYTLMCSGDRGVDVLIKVSAGTWWKWKRGSSLIFWRWGEESKNALFGFPPWILGALPRYKKRATKPKEDVFNAYVEKSNDIINKGYITAESNQSKGEGDFVLSLFDFFHVEKSDDIRMIYNGTSCGLNDSVWAPNF